MDIEFKKGKPYIEGIEVTGFDATGTLTSGKRFKLSYGASLAGYMQVAGINLYRGTKWARLATGKRRKIAEIYN